MYIQKGLRIQGQGLSIVNLHSIKIIHGYLLFHWTANDLKIVPLSIEFHNYYILFGLIGLTYNRHFDILVTSKCNPYLSRPTI